MELGVCALVVGRSRVGEIEYQSCVGGLIRPSARTGWS